MHQFIVEEKDVNKLVSKTYICTKNTVKLILLNNAIQQVSIIRTNLVKRYISLTISDISLALNTISLSVSSR